MPPKSQLQNVPSTSRAQSRLESRKPLNQSTAMDCIELSDSSSEEGEPRGNKKRKTDALLEGSSQSANDSEISDLEDPEGFPLDLLPNALPAVSASERDTNESGLWVIPQSAQDEETIVDFLLTGALFDILQSKAGLRPALQAAANSKGVNCLFGDKWMQEFLKRHPDIVRLRQEASSRRMSPNWSTGHFSSFLRLLTVLHERRYLRDAQRVIYADFSVLSIGGNQMKMSFEAGGPVFDVSVLSFGAASGGVLKPLLICDKDLINEEEWEFASEEEPKRRNKAKKRPTSTAAANSKPPVETIEPKDVDMDVPVSQGIFNAYVINELIPYLNSLPSDSPSKAVLYLSRGFWHLMTPSLLNIALENDIIVVPIAPGSKMDLRPWEVYEFSPMRWDQRVCFKDTKFTLDLLRAHGFARHLWEVAVQCYYDRNLPAEFQRLGLFPFPPMLENLIASTMERKTRYLYGSYVDVDQNLSWFKEVHDKLMRRFGITNEEAAVALQTVVDNVNEVLSSRTPVEVVEIPAISQGSLAQPAVLELADLSE